MLMTLTLFMPPRPVVHRGTDFLKCGSREEACLDTNLLQGVVLGDYSPKILILVISHYGGGENTTALTHIEASPPRGFSTGDTSLTGNPSYVQTVS